MAPILELCAASLPLAILTSYALQPLADARRRLPPCPRPLPVVGNLVDVANSLPHQSFARLAELHGPLISIRLGAVYAVVATSPEAAREILQKNNARMATRRNLDAWRAMGHDENSIVALPPRGKWRSMRRLSAAALLGERHHGEQCAAAVREEKVREMVRRVAAVADGRAGSGAPAVAVARAAFAVVLDVLCLGTFSEVLDPVTVEEVTDLAMEASVLSGTVNVSDLFPALAIADLQGVRRRMEKLMSRMYSVVDQQIERRRSSTAGGEPRKNDVLEMFLDMEGEEHAEGWVMNQDIIRGLFMEAVVGATSISTAIEWAMAELLQNPQTMKILQDEIRTILGTKLHIEESDINLLPYLQAVVKETLRLHTPAPFASTEAEETVEIQGYSIPEGTAALVNIWAICRSEAIWNEPEKFMPERFLKNDIDFFGTNFGLIPFGAGKRMCPGMSLSSRLLPMILGSLVRHFDWSLPEDTRKNGINMSETFGLFLSMTEPLRAVPKKIQ